MGSDAAGYGAMTSGDLAGLRALREDHRVKRSVVVCLEREPRTIEPGIDVLPWKVFLDRLWRGEFGV